eukprot:TRINITY_DN11036_c0_g1_i1.p1 TRINITY_DN11036_c0_g1~~TRINITY_DN11036_c0_g1_i1.p1  ORF type:complete len:344 (+),score=62.39 TRINITY_DN11036_c0_g1_i1:28-1032(+)
MCIRDSINAEYGSSSRTKMSTTPLGLLPLAPPPQGFRTRSWSFLARSPQQDANLVLMLDIPTDMAFNEFDLNMQEFVTAVQDVFHSHPDFFTNDRQTPADPTVVSELPKVPISPDLLEDHCSCSICLNDFAQEDHDLLQMPCGHHFHQDCLKPWLAQRNTCPVCRSKLAVSPAVANREDPGNMLRSLFASLGSRLRASSQSNPPEHTPDDAREAEDPLLTTSTPSEAPELPSLENPSSSTQPGTVEEEATLLVETPPPTTAPPSLPVATPPRPAVATPPCPAVATSPRPAVATSPRPAASTSNEPGQSSALGSRPLDVHSIVGRTAQLQSGCLL